MAIVKKYKSIVTRFIQPASDIFTVDFKALEKKYVYKPGQFLHLTLEEYDQTKPWPTSRCFSMQSNPSDEQIRITFIVKGEYTKRMSNELSLNKEVYLKLPYGDLFIKEHSKDNTVFIAGGTGVTPFLSLFTYEDFKTYKNPKLYLGVRKAEFNIYQDELKKSVLINPEFKHELIDEEKQGLLNIQSIFNAHGNKSTYFISGPVNMIKSFSSFLKENNVPNENIRTDEWE